MEISAAESRMKVTIFSVSSLPLTKYFVPLLSDATHTVGMTGSDADGEEVDADEVEFGADEEKFGADEEKFGADGEKFGADGEKFGADGGTFGADGGTFGADGGEIGADEAEIDASARRRALMEDVGPLLTATE